MDKLVDELARGRPMDKILRKEDACQSQVTFLAPHGHALLAASPR
jgi:hypothetical protein